MMVSGISATEVMLAVCFTVDSETQCSHEQYNVMTQQTSKCLQDNNSTNRSSSQKSTTDGSCHSAYCFAPGSLLKLGHTGNGHGRDFGFPPQPGGSSSAGSHAVCILKLRCNCLLLALVNAVQIHGIL